MKSKTKWWQDILWLVSLSSIILYPLGYVVGIMAGGFMSGFYAASDNFIKVSAEWERKKGGAKNG